MLERLLIGVFTQRICVRHTEKSLAKMQVRSFDLGQFGLCSFGQFHCRMLGHVSDRYVDVI